MKILLLTLLFVSVTTNVMAAWEEVSTTDDATIYADFATIRRTGEKVKMWNVWDYNTVQDLAGDKFLSSKAQDEYDCKEEQNRSLIDIWFSGNMGNGKVIYSRMEPNKWNPVVPGSIGHTLWEIACGKLSQWTRVDANDVLTQYADYSTIRKAGSRVKMWMLFDHKSVQEDAAVGAYLSAKVQHEYDCKDKRKRIIAFSFFSGNRGNGELVYSDRDSTNWAPKWEKIGALDEGAESKWKRACSTVSDLPVSGGQR